MKKLLSLFLLIVCTATLSACTQKAQVETNTPTESYEEIQEEQSSDQEAINDLESTDTAVDMEIESMIDSQ